MDIRLRWTSEPTLDCVVWQAVAGVLLATMAGCGGQKPLRVSGVVTLDDQPVADAGVLFCPAETGTPAGGTTDANGRFRLATINTPGVLPGEYRVTVAKKEVSGMIGLGIIGPQGMQVKWIVPEKYGKLETSGLRAVVGRDHTEFSFALSSRQ